MSMKFNPSNTVIQLCLKGMSLEESGNSDNAMKTFMEAWDQSTDDFERFIVAYHIGIRQKDSANQLKWLEKSLDFALNVNDDSVESAYPTLYSKIATCYEALNDTEYAKKYIERARSYQGKPTDMGPFYHGTKADLQVGDMLTAGGRSNYETDFRMNHIYFTSNINGAGLAATLAKGDEEERVYVVEPTGEFENDPNVTDKKFPGNLTQSYRSKEPLKIVGEESNWKKLTSSIREEWDEKLAKNEGEIIN